MTASLDAPALALAQPPARPGSAAVRTGLPLAPSALTAVVLSGQAMAFAAFAATCALLSWLTSAGGWPWQATALLVIAGAAHGTGFDVLAHRTAAGVPAARAASFSGVLATVNQLAIVTGVAVAGTIYLSARMPVVLLALAAAQAVTGAALARRALTQPASLAAAC